MIFLARLALVAGLAGALSGADAAAAFEVHAPPVRLGEGGRAEVQIVREPGDPDHVRLLPVSGTARAGEDFDAAPIDIGPRDFGGEGAAWVVVNTLTDAEAGEPDETFAVRTEDGSRSAELTIHEYPPDLASLETVGPYFTTNENEGATTVSVTAWNDGSEPLVVDYRTVDAQGRAGEDYAAAAGRLTFEPAATTTHEIRVALLDDQVDEGTDPFYVLFTGERTYDQAHRVFIGNDDHPRLTMSDAAVREGDDATTMRFDLRLSNPSVREHVAVMTAIPSGRPDTARELHDFVPTESAVVFPPGQLHAVYEVPVVGDQLDEDRETFNVYPRYLTGLQSPMGTLATGVIEDDDDVLAQPALAAPRLMTSTRVAVPISCRGRRACPVRLSLSFPAVARSAANRPRGAISRRVRVAAGKRRVVRLTLPRAQRRRLARGMAIRVRAVAVVRERDGDVARVSKGGVLRRA